MTSNAQIFVVLACAVAACGDDDHGPRPTPTVPPTSTVPPSATPAATNTVPPATVSATAAPTGTATAIPTGTATATVTPVASPSIVDELEAAGVGRYLDITPASMTTTPNGVCCSGECPNSGRAKPRSIVGAPSRHQPV